jgi:hypothetical protein
MMINELEGMWKEAFAWRDLENARKTPVKIPGLRARI